MWSAVAPKSQPNVTLSGVPATAAYQSQFSVSTNNNGTTTSRPTITAGPGSVCSIIGNTVTMLSGSGICLVTATWLPDSNYSGFVITEAAAAAKIAPNVNFNAPGNAPYLTMFTVMTNNNHTTTSTPMISAGNGSPCSVRGDTVTMTGGTGTCTLTATWEPDHNYLGTTLTQTTRASEIKPTVTFTGAPQTAAYQSTFLVMTNNENTTRSVPVISALNDGGCTISGHTITMTSGTNVCNLTATWAPDGNYLGAVLNQFTQASKIAPKVTFTGAPPSAAYGSTFAVSATTNASSSAVFGIAAGSNACNLSGATVTMSSGTGTCIVSANWQSDTNYNAASLTQTTAALKAPLTVTANNAVITFGQPLPTLTASYSGFVNNDTPGVLSGAPILSTTGTSYSIPKSYPITVAIGTLASSNYSFVGFTSGALTVNPTGTVPPQGNACNGAYQGGTFNGQITVAPNQICEIDHGVVKGNLISGGGIVILVGSTVTGNVQIDGAATGPSAKQPNLVCASQIQGYLFVGSDPDSVIVGGTACGTTTIGQNVELENDTGAVSVSFTNMSGSLVATNNTSTVLLSGNSVGQNLQVQNNSDSAVNATQVLNNKVVGTITCSGNASITGSGNTAKQKLGQCATF